MRRSRLLLPLCAGLVLLFAIPARPAGAGTPAEPFRFPEKRHGKGELKYVNKVPVLRVEGTPEEIGEQVGVLALKPAARALDYPHGLFESFAIPPLFWSQAIKQGKAMVEHFPSDYRKEMKAMTKASGAPWAVQPRHSLPAQGQARLRVGRLPRAGRLPVGNERRRAGGGRPRIVRRPQG